MTDLASYQDPMTIQRLLHTSKTIADRGVVEQRATAQLLRRLLPQAARLSGHTR